MGVASFTNRPFVARPSQSLLCTRGIDPCNTFKAWTKEQQPVQIHFHSVARDDRIVDKLRGKKEDVGIAPHRGVQPADDIAENGG